MLKGSILQTLKEAHQGAETGKRSLNFGVYYKNTLVSLCHALEDSILTDNYSPLVITAFQRGKWYLEEADRYGEIADRAQQIVIMAAPDAGFAEHPTSQRSNVALVSLDPVDPVAQEWHLIIASPSYTAMVLCQELTPEDYGVAGVPEMDRERKFYGLWTFEPTLVQETAELAIAHIRRYNPTLSTQLADQLQAIKAQSHYQTGLAGVSTPEQLGDIVSRVVNYLQASQQDLLHNAPSYAYPGQGFLDNNLVSNELQAFLRIAQLIDQTDISNPMTAAEIATLAETLGQLLDLPAWQLHRLRLAGLLHRIGSLSQETELSPSATHRYDPDAVPLACPLVPGAQLLRTMNRMKAIATIITHQTEWWNGSGLPARLAGDAIPLESRMLGLVAEFQAHLAAHRTPDTEPGNFASYPPEALSSALAACQAEAGDRWDPKLVETLALLVGGLQQGLNLPVNLPKIAAGIWLLDSHSDDELLPYIDESSSPASPSVR
ncbi:metal-dependent phosphohydrolase [Oscillatoria sp. FACHB-1407]|uniref:DICT sensory domain-containing protein n=1 Tax=Oscillatoria sp. FACHB-1407 TaxID=2692847 RepID=UPI001683928F|nr:DICT sensory domain-containing protein [Oscillatoria sp. FACHB-1407]MBD2464127.1 metal-dependent phosphohydrolase [Oscillatoria sp. FACHB-1407]